MRASPVLPLHLRRLMAVLTVLAACMFQARIGGSIEQVGAHAGHEAAASVPTPVSDPHAGHNMAGHGMAGHGMAGHEGHPVPPPPAAPPTQASTSTPASSGPSSEPAPAHDHGAHCPFCVTNAFGEDAGTVLLPAGPFERAEITSPDVPRVIAVRRRGVEARAPPRALS